MSEQASSLGNRQNEWTQTLTPKIKEVMEKQPLTVLSKPVLKPARKVSKSVLP